MSWIEALILGIVQGLTEFLPISSSGHLELGSVVFGLQDPDGFFTFNIMVHGATFMSVLVVFRKDILSLLGNVLRFRWNEDTRFVLYLLASAIPVAVVGLLLEQQIEAIFSGRVIFVGCMLLVTATLLFLTRFAPHRNHDINLKRALIIGLAQAVAVLPGISRSGATISTALLLGVERTKAVRFSFLMVLIPVLGANLLKILILSSETGGQPIEVLPLVIGAIAAFIAGLFACKWMLAIVAKGKIEYFAAYCLLVGLAAIVAGIMIQ